MLTNSMARPSQQIRLSLNDGIFTSTLSVRRMNLKYVEEVILGLHQMETRVRRSQESWNHPDAAMGVVPSSGSTMRFCDGLRPTHLGRLPIPCSLVLPRTNSSPVVSSRQLSPQESPVPVRPVAVPVPVICVPEGSPDEIRNVEWGEEGAPFTRYDTR